MTRDLTDVVKAYDIRGVVPDQWGAAEAAALGAATADVLARPGTSLVVGHDMRPSSPELVRAFARGAAARGTDVVLVGLVSTDGLYYASGALNSPGAMFTASHNPAQYNGIKLCRAGAQAVGQETGLAEIRRRAATYLSDGLDQAPRTGEITERDVLADYARHLRSLVDLSTGRRLSVVVDAGNGMAGHTVPAVLGEAAGLPELPLRIEPLYFELDGTFPNHEANPLEPENLRDLQAAVVEHHADLGLAFDGDADRCFVVDEQGRPVSPSAITALVALREVSKELAAGHEPTILHNLITSAAVPELVRAAGGTPVRTKVGHSNIKALMATSGAIFGGEHSAHYYFREFWGADTGMLAAMHVLAALQQSAGTLSALVSDYDRYISSGEINSRIADVPAAITRVRAAFEGRGELDELDGTTFSALDGPMWWFSLRASNTEPLLRLNVEAADTATMEGIRDEVLDLVRADQ
ncbi:MAG: phosphomannomutase/phosphoglucomutase [Actinomycetales bacterium]